MVVLKWWVHQPNGPPLGPFPAEAIAEAIVQGRLPSDVWVAAQGDAARRTEPRWLRAADVPIIAARAPRSAAPTWKKFDDTIETVPSSSQGWQRFDDTVKDPAVHLPKLDDTIDVKSEDLTVEIRTDPPGTLPSHLRRSPVPKK
jgi:hypothetical protein